MHARIWQLRSRPGKTEDLKAAIDSLVPPARQLPGFRGVLALGSAAEATPNVTIIGLWDSLDSIRNSERNMFLMQAITRIMGCCEGLPHITEQEVLISDIR